jgi:hypothetical protein
MPFVSSDSLSPEPTSFELTDKEYDTVRAYLMKHSEVEQYQRSGIFPGRIEGKENREQRKTFKKLVSVINMTATEGMSKNRALCSARIITFRVKNLFTLRNLWMVPEKKE